MALNDFADEVASPWGTTNVPAPTAEPTVQGALEKERVIKDIISLRDGLRGLMVRIDGVEKENEKLKKENDMLSIYIDNLTRNSVVAAGNKR